MVVLSPFPAMGFQLIRFNPIGREFAAEPISRVDFSRQIDAPSLLG